MTPIKHLAHSAFKKWVGSRYTEIQAEQVYEQDSKKQTALLTSEIAVLETELAAYDFHQTVIDYEGIQKIRIDGEIVTAWTKTEQYTVRIHTSDDLFLFFKNLQLPQTTHTLIDREKWIITTPVASHVHKEDIPKLDFLYVDNHGARLHVDLAYTIELNGVRGILSTLQGEFNLHLNMDKIKHVLQTLGDALNSFGGTDYFVKIDATDVRKLTFYVENEEGDSYALEDVAPFDVERLIVNPIPTTTHIKSVIGQVLPAAQRTLHLQKAARKKKERTALRMEKEANINRHLPRPQHVQVEVVEDCMGPEITINRLSDKIILHIEAVDAYLPALVQIDNIKRQIENETIGIQRFIKHMHLSLDGEHPYSLEENYIRMDITKEIYPHLVEDVRLRAKKILVNTLTERIQKEQPQVRSVLERLTFEEGKREMYCLVHGYLDTSISLDQYQQLTAAIRRTLRQIALYELADTYQDFPVNIRKSVFGISVKEDTISQNRDYVYTVTIEKEGEPPYQKRFQHGKLLPVI